MFEPSATPKERPGALNLWRGFAVEPKQGDWSLMQAHILNVLANGNEAHAKYILDWMAYGVQHPEAQAETAMCFAGDEGAGKGVVWRYYGEIFGPHFQHFSEQDQFTGKFNSQLGKAVFLFLDEALWGGNKSVAGKIKAMITEPTLQIEPKGIDRMQVPNRLSIVASSNEDWSVPLGIGDRRWAVFAVSNRYAYKNCRPAERRAYFKALYTQMANGGQAAMLYDLLRRKVSADDIRDVPNTEAKAHLKSLNLAPTPMWVEMILDEGALADCPWTEEGLVIDRSLPFGDYLQFCVAHGKRPDPAQKWWASLEKILGDAVDREYRPRVNGKPGPRKFRFGPLKQCRDRFDRYAGNEIGGAHWAAPPQAASTRDFAQPSHLHVEPQVEYAAD